MHTIWKFPLEIMDEQSIEVPYGAKFLSIQVQRDAPCVWMLVEPEAPLATQRFSLRGTGQPFDVGPLSSTIYTAGFLGTFQLLDGDLVFHLFNAGQTRLFELEEATPS